MAVNYDMATKMTILQAYRTARGEGRVTTRRISELTGLSLGRVRRALKDRHVMSYVRSHLA